MSRVIDRSSFCMRCTVNDDKTAQAIIVRE